MKKISKRILSLTMALLIILLATPLAGFVGVELPNLSEIFATSAEAAEYTEGIYTYTVIGDRVTITRCDTSASGAITIPSTLGGYPVANIGYCAFLDCKSLTSITIPDSVTTIGDYAFSQCASLTNITILNGVISIGIDAFGYTGSLTSITVSTDNANYSSQDGVLFNKDKTELVRYPAGKTRTSYTIPDSVTRIDVYAFAYSLNLTSIIIPDSVICIHYGAFNLAKSLTSVSIPNSVTFIGPETFTGCYSLTDVYYNGTEEQWNAITTHLTFDDLEFLTNAKIHFNSTGEVTPEEPINKISLISISPNKGEPYFSIYDGEIIFTFDKNIEEIIDNNKLTIDNQIVIKEYDTGNKIFPINDACYIADVDKNQIIIKNLYSKSTGTQASNIKCGVKYYIEISKDLIPNFEFAGLSGKDTYTFSTYVNDDGTLSEDGYKQVHATDDFEYWNNKKVKNNFNGAGIPIDDIGDGINSRYDMCIPGVKEDMIPQGMTYYKDKNWVLISAYNKVAEKDKPKQRTSVIFALDYETGKFVAQFNIYKARGDKADIHAGGIAATDNNLYITYGTSIAYIPLSEFDVEVNTVKDVYVRSSVDLSESMKKTKSTESANIAYLNYSDGILWAGNFYYDSFQLFLPDSWDIPASDKYNSVIQGYKLSGDTHWDEWNSFTKMVKANNSTYHIGIPNNIKGIQGATVKAGILYLSQGSMVGGSKIFAKMLVMDEREIYPTNKWNNKFVEINNIAGAQNIFIKDGYLYCLYESEAWCETKIGDVFFEETGVVWKADIDKMFKGTTLHQLKCPIDVEVYDKDTGELVGRIKDNAVDETVAKKENSIIMQVDGETKYFWLPDNGNYEIKILGNGNGEMDYTATKFDGNLDETERVNFFDVDITTATVLTGDIVEFEKMALTDENSNVIKVSEYIESESVKHKINISTDGNGNATESFSATSGDYVAINAIGTDKTYFCGWYENGNLLSTLSEYSFVVQKSSNIVAVFKECDTILRNPSTTTIDYGDKIILHADIYDAISAGVTYRWEASNSNFNMDISADGTSCTISPQSSGNTTITLTVFDEAGNVIATDTQEMTSNAGLWQKIVAFFKKIFGLTKVIPQAFKFTV